MEKDQENKPRPEEKPTIIEKPIPPPNEIQTEGEKPSIHRK